MKIVVLDGYTENPGDLSWEGLEALGQVTVYDRTSYVDAPVIAERIGDAQVAVVNKTPITRATVDRCLELKMVAVLATGYNVVDYEYCREKGILVANVPAYGTDIVGQYAVGLLLEICSHFWCHSESVHKGRWAASTDWCYWDYPMIELAGKTAGIIGLGRIGQTTARILGAMNMRVMACDSHHSDAGKAVAEYVDLDRLLAESDVITLHVPLLESNYHMINRDTIAKMKDGVILVNCSRGELADLEALVEGIESEKLGALGMDTSEGEEGIIHEDHRVDILANRNWFYLHQFRNVIMTQHMAFYTDAAVESMVDCGIRGICRMAAGERFVTEL